MVWDLGCTLLEAGRPFCERTARVERGRCACED